ncbi:Outer membrane protein TolC [Acinetobacter marinus]|uniref:Outer membrane protein TolC n=2 Tax=Acinetobacter marinus TaxID=281375 RepID=A0A1G6HTK9_9GAMM|nr:TolC family protein [Acinetobacter marinus]SDB97572.1 Outer membrane protein TolC [Acinetobacter marinus]
MRQKNDSKTIAYSSFLFDNFLNKNTSRLLLGMTALASSMAFAQSYSFEQAEQRVFNESYSMQSQRALQQAAELEAQAVKHLGLPRVDLNARAYAFHAETDVPLDQFKQSIEDQLSQRVSDRISELENAGVPSSALDGVQSGINNIIHDGVSQFPNYAHLELEDEVFRPTVSVSMPIYTGGLTSSAKEIAKIRAQGSRFDQAQDENAQRYQLITRYFDVQLQQQLFASSQNNLNAMQRHLDNALKLEQQGFISRGQRMQFEVARNNADRLYQSAQRQLQSSQYQLQNLLHSLDTIEPSTPLFVNEQQSLDLTALMDSYAENSPLIQKLQNNTVLAQQNVKVKQAAQKPKVFGFGEYALDDEENWIVGVMASYNLFSGIDKRKQVQAAQLQSQAAQLLTEQSKVELANVIYSSYQSMLGAQRSHQLLKDNMRAAEENLRIQTLSFREDMGTATDVIDAENNINALHAEIATNAYKYVMSLATLLQSHGSLDQFQNFIHAPDSDKIVTTVAGGTP